MEQETEAGSQKSLERVGKNKRMQGMGSKMVVKISKPGKRKDTAYSCSLGITVWESLGKWIKRESVHCTSCRRRPFLSLFSHQAIYQESKSGSIYLYFSS